MKNIQIFEDFSLNEKSETEIRIEKSKDESYIFIEVLGGDKAHAKTIQLTPEQRSKIEKVLNS